MFKRAKLFVFILFLPICFLITSCRPCDENNESCIRIPDRDNTLPREVTLNISEEVEDKLLRLVYVDQASSPDHIPDIQPTGQLVVVTAGAEDSDGGIKSLELWVQEESCRTIIDDGEELVECVGPGLLAGPRVKSMSDAEIGEFTRKKRSLIRVFDLDEELGNTYTRLYLEIWVEAENFHGGRIVTPRVTITYP